MEYRYLGNTGLEVSRLCFGGLIIGPLQANLSPAQGADVIQAAFEQGVNFIDTAQLYGTYHHVREGLRRVAGRAGMKEPVVASKCYAYSHEQAAESLEKARRELDRDVIDIFEMHEQESRLTLAGHQEALAYYLEAKSKGIIRAVGVSTHHIEVVDACADMEEIDVIHPIVNYNGLGIADGHIEEMLLAVQKAHEKGKGIYSMKALGGGNLISKYDDAMHWVMDIPFIHSIAVGMQNIEEVDFNVAFFNGSEIDKNLADRLGAKKRHLHIDEWCTGCSKCIDRCGLGALSLKDGKAVVREEVCVKCGYCSSECKEFAIKIF